MQRNFYYAWIFLPLLCACKEVPIEDVVPLPPTEIKIIPKYSAGSIYYFKYKSIFIEIESLIGSRISSLKFDGKELLYNDRSNGNVNWGSTFLPSPQSLYDSSLLSEFESKPYNAIIQEANLSVVSDTANSVGLYVTKTFKAEEIKDVITMEYKIHNTNPTTKSLAPWEITRIPSGGLTFFPKGDSTAWGITDLVKDSIGITWLGYDSSRTSISGSSKLFSDGAEGWLAHLNKDGIIIIKKFTDTPLSKRAPGEAEIEIRLDPEKKYIELGVQGSYGPALARGNAVYEVKWYVRQLPLSIKGTLGNKVLADYVRDVIK